MAEATFQKLFGWLKRDGIVCCRVGESEEGRAWGVGGLRDNGQCPAFKWWTSFVQNTFFTVLVLMTLEVTGDWKWSRGKSEGSLSPPCCPRIKEWKRQNGQAQTRLPLSWAGFLSGGLALLWLGHFPWVLFLSVYGMCSPPLPPTTYTYVQGAATTALSGHLDWAWCCQ